MEVTASQIFQYTRNSIYEQKKVKNGHAFACKQILSIKENVKSCSTCPTFPFQVAANWRNFDSYS